ncbi:MAG: glycerol-3-phosphate acyltransferase [Synechococcus sp.]
MQELSGWLTSAALALTSFGLGCLPLPLWIVRTLTGEDLREVGTGNISVAATFKQMGPAIGVAVVGAEIVRGVAPVFVALWLLPDWPATHLGVLIPLVVGRYVIAKGGGVTNVSWGVLVYSPAAVLLSALTGLATLGVAKALIHSLQVSPTDGTVRNSGIYTESNNRWSALRSSAQKSSARRWSARIGCASGALWVAVLEKTLAERWVALGLVGLLVWIDLQQRDDAMALVSLDRPLDPKQYGAKAARLAQLKRHGIQVPQGWGLPVSSEIDPNVIKQVNPSDAHPLMVRSSAIGEDGDSSSAAGQYRTVGPVRSGSELMAAVEVCRDSYGDGSAVAYRKGRGLTDAGMSILLQHYVEGQVSGVAFSRHPIHGLDRIVIEALPGGAEAVVGGTQTPLHWELSRIQQDWSEANLRDLLSMGDRHVASVLLPANVLRQLAELVLQIETLFDGIPQDLEWIWDGEQIWIVQSRPISTLQPVWTRTIAAEVIPGAIHPLTWSVNQPLTCGVWGTIFSAVLGQRATDLDFSQTATLLGSHAYFNATLLGEIFSRMGLPEQGLEFLLRGQKMGRPPLASTLRNLSGLLRLKQKEGRLPEEFYRDFDELFKPAIARLESTSLDSLSPVQLLDRVDFIRETLIPATYYNILGPIGLAIRKSLFKVSESWLDDTTAPELAALRDLAQIAAQYRSSTLSNQLGTAEVGTGNSDSYLASRNEDIETMMSEHPQLKSQFNDWLDRYGYLSEAGTDIAVPTWSELPDTIFSLFQTFAQQPENAPQQASRPKNALQQWRSNQCRERASVQASIDEVYGKLLAHLRWTFVELERRGITESVLHQEGDIFFLRLGEIKEWVGGMLAPERLQPMVLERRQQLHRDRERQIPTVVYGNRLPPAETRSSDPLSFVNSSLGTEGLMSGIPASGGCVEGTVKVCRQLKFDTFEPGTIVVVPYTDAGWAPLLVNAVAIISEVGGQLSHGAIVAREYNIPAVMNVEQAMVRLKDGQRVRVNGDRGTVELC